MRLIKEATGFDWDFGNERKSKEKHGVTMLEAEEVFFNTPVLLIEDSRHSQQEPRFNLLGKTDKKRLLHITFTMREKKIRVISARDMHKKERFYYESNTKV